MEIRRKTRYCCFCGKDISKLGEENNPQPLCQEYGSACCCKCNEQYVLPVREALENVGFNPFDWIGYPYIPQVTLEEIESSQKEKDPITALRRIIFEKASASSNL